MNILITGGAGFIGSNLAEKLSNKHNVTIIDNLSTGHITNIKSLIESRKVIFYKGDIRDSDLLNKVLIIFSQSTT